MISDLDLASHFEILEESFHNTLRYLEELSSVLHSENLVSKEFASLLEDLYYSRDKLREIRKKTLSRVKS